MQQLRLQFELLFEQQLLRLLELQLPILYLLQFGFVFEQLLRLLYTDRYLLFDLAILISHHLLLERK